MTDAIVDKKGGKSRAAAVATPEVDAPVRALSESLRFLNDGFADVTRLLDRWQEVFEAAKRGPIPPSLVTEAEAALEEIDVAQLRREIPTAVERALKGLGELAVAIRAMREVDDPSSNAKAPTDLREVIEGVATIARAEYVKTVEIETHVADALPPLFACRGELHRALLVLVERAADAIADAVRKRDGARGHITITADQKGDQIRVVVEDDGRQIPSECCPSLLGRNDYDEEPRLLAGVSEIVCDRHSGRILFESGTGRGTRFHLLLPLAGPAA